MQCLRYMSCFAYALDNSSCFYSWLLEDYYERGQSKHILIKLTTFEANTRWTCQVNFRQKRIIPYNYISFSVITKF